MLKTLDAFQFDAQPELDRDAILQLCSGAFVTEAANVVLVGGVGTGKTHLAIALGMACCQHDYRVRFLTAAELTTLLVEAQQQGRLARKLDQLARFDVVIVDELGYVPFDKAGADLLFGEGRRFESCRARQFPKEFADCGSTVQDREGVSASAAVARARSHDHGREDARPAPLEEGGRLPAPGAGGECVLSVHIDYRGSASRPVPRRASGRVRGRV